MTSPTRTPSILPWQRAIAVRAVRLLARLAFHFRIVRVALAKPFGASLHLRSRVVLLVILAFVLCLPILIRKFADPVFAPAFLIAFLYYVVARMRYGTILQQYSEPEISWKHPTGRAIARHLLRKNGLEVRVRKIAKHVEDGHYNASSREIQLSPVAYRKRTTTAMAIAAHEVGHVTQHADAYRPFIWLHYLRLLAKLSTVVLAVAFLFDWMQPRVFVATALSLDGLCALVAVPVELNASRRAMSLLDDAGFLSSENRPQVRKILRAAAWTYAAGTAQLLMIVPLLN